MKLFVIVGLILALSTPAKPQSTPNQSDRLQIAINWLSKLCVVKDGDFLVPTSGQLNDEFDKWTKDKNDVALCDPKTFPSKPPPEINVDVADIRLNALERIARMPQFRLQIQQTPDYVYGVQQGQPVSTPNTFLPNPDHSLISFGGPVHLDELYVGADTRVAICSAITKTNGIVTDPRCKEATYLLATRKRDRFTRIGAATTLDLNFSQVPRFESAILVPSVTGLGFPAYAKTITGSFDPSKLFRSTAEMKGLAGYVSQVRGVPSFDQATVLRGLCDYGPDQLNESANTGRCIRAITIGKKTQRIVISALPTINVTVTTPFDLAKYGSALIAPPNKEGQSLYNVTLNWSLHNIVASTSSRLDAFNALKTIQKPASTPLDNIEIKEALWRRQVAGMYMELRTTPAICLDPAWWAKFESTVLRQN